MMSILEISTTLAELWRIAYRMFYKALFKEVVRLIRTLPTTSNICANYGLACDWLKLET